MGLPDVRDIAGQLRAAGCVFAEDEAAELMAAASGPEQLSAMLAARVSGEPLEHILGWARFCGMRVGVTPGVFVPRRRSELLVSAAAMALRPGAVVVDLCCGTGALGLALARRERVELHAVDLDAAAVACARSNLAALPAFVYEGDLFAPLPEQLRGRVDVLVANAPYVPSDEIAFMPPEAREHEHRLALDGGPDGLAVQRRIAAAAPAWLAPAGQLLIETAAAHAPATAAAMAAAGLPADILHDELIDATVVAGSRPG